MFDEIITKEILCEILTELGQIKGLLANLDKLLKDNQKVAQKQNKAGISQ